MVGISESDDPRRPGAGPGSGDSTPQYVLAGYSDDGQPVYRDQSGNLFIVGANGYEPYSGNVNDQPPDRTGTPDARHGAGGDAVPPPNPGASTAGGDIAPPQNLIAPFNVPFTPPTATAIPNGPTPPQIPEFTPPSLADAMNDPGFKFSTDEGNRNLTNWLAAHGTFNDSSAARALYDYGANAAQTRYNDVWGRAYNQYQTNVQTQYLDPWQQAYQNFAVTAPLVSHTNDMNWQNAFNQWIQDWNVWKDQRDSTFDKQYRVATS